MSKIYLVQESINDLGDILESLQEELGKLSKKTSYLQINFEKALAEKERGIVEHIQNAARDGCVCEPCVAVRENANV